MSGPSRRVAYRRDGLSLDEEQFAQWAEARGLITVFDTLFPTDEGEPFDPVEVRALVKEALCSDGRHHAFHIDITDYAVGWPRSWAALEDLLLQGWRVHLSEAGVEEVDEL